MLLAKGAGRLYLITEVLADSLMFLLYLLGYTRWGLAGVGVAYLLAYLCSGVGIYLLCRVKFGLRVSVNLFFYLLAYAVICYGVWQLESNGLWIGASLLTLCICIYSVLRLKKRLSGGTDRG